MGTDMNSVVPFRDRGSGYVAYWHFSDVITCQNYFRFRMYCRRDVLVASLSAFDPLQTWGHGIELQGIFDLFGLMSASFTTFADFVTGPRGEPNAVEGRAFLISCRLAANERRGLDDKRQGSADTSGGGCIRTRSCGDGDRRDTSDCSWFACRCA